MTSEPYDPLEAFWDAILSRQPERIRAAYLPLDQATRGALISHLTRMVSEPGWHLEQIQSAQAALDALEGFDSQ